MKLKEYYLKENEINIEHTSLSTNVQFDNSNSDFNNKLKQLLNVKFAEVGKYIKELTRSASKG